MSAKTILYVEDNEMNRKIVRDLLKHTTYRLLEAPDGEAGVAMALEKRPDLILMDVQLPKVSGFEATKALRAEPGDGRHADHRDHLLRAERRRREGARGGGHRVPGQALQPVRAPRNDPEAGARKLSDGAAGREANVAVLLSSDPQRGPGPSRIEAGRIELALDAHSVHDVETVLPSTRSPWRRDWP